LSTKIRNAHIPLVSQSNNVVHQTPKVIHFVISDIFNFSEKYCIISFINANPNNNTNGPDKKFILTAIVSGDNHHPPKTDPILNQNPINECRKKGIAHHFQIFPQINPKFSAIIFGTYKYS